MLRQALMLCCEIHKDQLNDAPVLEYHSGVSSYKKASDFTKSVTASADYDTAQKIRDESIK